ncbi:transporter [Aureisphaera galaxeae]|uniref:transporter n=1 Tax=Aureisphaera galaxeae TaxID=1538023 RepID=UPI0023506E8B|nr:transporter [Aureisphaera galaxeae]MDC8003941.1 transporter [Aureisphaera galaxeae]
MRILRNLLFIALLCPISAVAQYTEMINTNRPGVSQGAFSVGKNVLQFETGFSLGKEKHNLLETETNAFAWDYSVRYGFFKEELEISLIGLFQSNKVTDSRGVNPFEFTESNFRSNTIGAKYLVYDPYRKKVLEGPNLLSWKKNNKFQWSDLIPAVSVYAGANFDFADNPFTPEQESSISPKVVVSTQNNLIGGFVIVTNIIADRITTDFPSYGYIVTVTHATNDYFSVFVENQGFKSDFYADNILRGGAAALINEDFHVDLSLSINFKDTPSLFYGRVGLAYRFDMHKEDEFIEEKGKAAREAKRAEKEKNRALKKKKKETKKNKKRKDSFELEDDGGAGGLN